MNGGESWSSWYNQPTAAFYHVNTDNGFPYQVCAGQQESGSACVAASAGASPQTSTDIAMIPMVNKRMRPLSPVASVIGSRSVESCRTNAVPSQLAVSSQS